jgi:glutamate dehydrogenase/leucine dehydrogenase
VIVSYFEWEQNMKNQSWELEEVNKKLKEKIVASFKIIWDYSQKYNLDLRLAAYVLAVARILEAEQKRN